MSSAYPYSNTGQYVKDRASRPASPSPLEQEHINKAIAASLALHGSGSGFDGPAVLPAVATAEDNWASSTQKAVLKAAGSEAWDPTLQNPLYASAEQAKSDKAESGSSADSPPATAEAPQATQTSQHKPWTITHMVEEMALRLAVDLPLLNDSEADTLVFIDPASQQPSQDDHAYRLYTTRYRLPHRMRREKFLALNSPYFEKAFGPSNQHRVLRRRGLVNKLPEGIKYVLDLTPPMEGEDAVYLMTELCCSIGVRRWFQAGQRWNVAKRLVGGQDEPQMEPHTVAMETRPSQGIDKPDSSVVRDPDDPIGPDNWTPEHLRSSSSRSASGSNQQGVSPASTTDSLPLEYSAVRHRAAIERVLHAAVEGLDPRIDSAPKLWTTFAVAKYFEITHSPLTDYIVRWLRAPPNSYFLEVLPETSQKIADGLQCWDLCRDTFAILVGEEALGNVCRTRDQPKGDTTHSVYGRSREDVHEDYQTRIEYASKSFIERVGARFAGLVNQSMTWLDDIPECSTLSELEQTAEYKGTIKEIKDMLKAYVRGRIYWVCCRNYKGLTGPVPDTRRSGSDLFPTASFTETFNSLLLQERIFTRSLWEALKQEDFSQGMNNTYTDENDLLSPISGWTPLAQRTYEAKLFEKVAKWRIEDRINKLDDIHALLYRSMEPTIGQVAPTGRSEWWSQVEEPVKRLRGLSLLSPKKVKSDRIDERDDIEHDGKRRRVSGDLEDRPLIKTEGSQSSSKLPIRLAAATPSFNKDIDIFPPLLEQHLNKVTSPDYAKDPSDTTIKEEVIACSELRSEAPVFKPQTTRKTSPSPSTTSQTPLLHNHQPQPTIAPSSLNPSQTDAFSSQPTTNNPKYPRFDLHTFLLQVNTHLSAICTTLLAPPDASTRSDTLELLLTDTLVCLAPSEWKFLPLWAGGNDDGSGGVFDDSVPLAEAAVSAAAPGPGFHTGLSSRGSSEFELVGGSWDGGEGEEGRTVRTSTVVNGSFDVDGEGGGWLDRRRVYGVGSVGSGGLGGEGGDGGSIMGTGVDQGTGKGKGKEKEKTEYADSEWSEVTAGTGTEVGDVLDSSEASMVDEEEEASGARQTVRQDELLDDIWDDGDDDDVASGADSEDGNGDVNDGGEKDEDEDEDMVLL